MSMHLWLTLAVFGGCLGMMIFTRYGPDLILMGGLAALLLFGVLSPSDALAGFSNEGILTIGVLFIVAAGLRETGALDLVVRHLFRRPRNVFDAQLRLMIPVSFASAFINNTPLVASMLPAVDDWARKIRISPSKLLIPLSYAAILGGTCTLVGTSTNLVVQGLLLERADTRVLGLFELAWVGVPCAIVGIIYVLAFSRWLLPARQPVVEQLKQPREYTVEMLVDKDSPLAGVTVEHAGLRQLPVCIWSRSIGAARGRAGRSPDEVLRAGDRLVFAGITDSIMDLQRIRGLTPATNQVFKLDSPRPCASSSRPSSRRAARPRTRLCASRVSGRATTRPSSRSRAAGSASSARSATSSWSRATRCCSRREADFAQRYANSRDFLLVSGDRELERPPRHDRAGIALGDASWRMVACAGMGWINLFTASVLAAGLDARDALPEQRARRAPSIDLAAAGGRRRGARHRPALETAGAGERREDAWIAAASSSARWDRSCVSIVTMVLLTELITNNAAAALMFPIAAGYGDAARR